MNIKIKSVDQLRHSLQETGYGTYCVTRDERDGVSEESLEIDYIPKSDTFLVDDFGRKPVQKLTVARMTRLYGEEMQAGRFEKVVD